MPGGPFGSGPFGDLPFGGTPESSVEFILVGFQADGSLGTLSWEVARALAGLQADAALGLLGDVVVRGLGGFQADATLGFFVEEEIVQLQGFAIPAALGVLGHTLSQVEALLGFQADARVGELFAVARHLLVHTALADRARGGIALGDSAVNVSLGDRG